MFTKIGESFELQLESAESCVSEVDANVLEHFQKIASALKKIAPKANDFLYFSASIIHAAEAIAINEDGSAKLTLNGEPLKVGWDTSGGTWKWTSNDANVRPYKNSNGDIFPEQQLINAYKKWVHKPLCIDHKSSSVDHTRGFIVDTYYDRKLKRVIALCALDKANYPDLAKKVSSRMQTAVSMGTGVGKAICYDCGRVAKAESDFCSHMRTKTGYGEINIDLNPIELSIVVNGADPKAHIKDVIASANAMNAYLETRVDELAKLAEVVFNASLSVNSNDTGLKQKNQTINISATDLNEFKKEIESACQKLQDFKATTPETDNNLALNQTDSGISMDESPQTDSGLSLQTPQNVRLASQDEDDSLNKLHKITSSIEVKLDSMKQSLDKLANFSTLKQHKEETMSSGSKEINKQGYFQGAGGVNEPTPGQVKYPKDPLNEHDRVHEDKQMVGQSPFPEVGDVDGMHPSPASADPSNELDRKKMLARAEVEERAMKREAIVQKAKDALKNKEAYWLGGGGVNEPTPGKVKYPKDKLNEDDRDNEDKQMVGQPPFPGVGAVDGLHPSPASSDVKDELKRKEMLARANRLSARFNKSADKGNSAWEVFLGDKLVLTASVNDLCDGHPTDSSYDGIATKEFGAKLIEKVKAQGAESVSKLIKKAQVPPPPAAAEAPAAPPAEDAGKDGDPKDSALELAEKVRDLSSDLVESVRALSGEQAEMGATDMPAAPMAADDSKTSEAFSASTLNSFRKDLNSGLIQSMKSAIAELNEHGQELNMIVDMYNNGQVPEEKREFVGSVVQDALSEAKTSVANGFNLMAAFVKYANATKAITKRAEVEAELKALAEGDSMDSKQTNEHSADGGDDLMGLINDTNADLDAVNKMMTEDSDKMGDLDLDGLLDKEPGDEQVVDDTNDLTFEPGEKVPSELAGKNLTMTATASLDTKEGRSALRAKLAADALGKEDDGEERDMSKEKFSPTLLEANKLTSGRDLELDVKPSDNLGLVETLVEQNKAFLDVAKMPPKVRKEAEVIQKLISEGKLDVNDVDALVSEGGLDKDAVSYWKKYYGEVDGGSEFASELVKEHVKASMEEEFGKYRVKLARAYELTYDMIDRGLCRNDRPAISDNVDLIMKSNDEGFESLKRVVARHEPVLRKEASRIPQVGIREDVEYTPESAVETNEFEQLGSALGKRKMMF